MIVCDLPGARLDCGNWAAYHFMVNAAVAFAAPDQARWIIGQTLKVARETKFRVSMPYAGEPLT